MLIRIIFNAIKYRYITYSYVSHETLLINTLNFVFIILRGMSLVVVQVDNCLCIINWVLYYFLHSFFLNCVNVF